MPTTEERLGAIEAELRALREGRGGLTFLDDGTVLDRRRLLDIVPGSATLTDERDAALGLQKIKLDLSALLASAAPPDADYLVGTADPDLSNEIVVGASPGGELGGTWASPTVDATHSGSAHHTRSHALDSGDDHTGTLPADDIGYGIAVAAISSGSITLEDGVSFYILTGEGGVADTLTDIVGGANGQVIVLIALNGYDITLDHAAGTNGTRIYTSESVDIVMNGGAITGDPVVLIKQSIGLQGGWWVLSPRQHRLLDGGGTHSGTVADGPTRGSLIYGNATPAWDELVAGSPGEVLTINIADVQWQLFKSQVTYVWGSDSAIGADVATGDAQGALYHHSGNQTEDVRKIVTDFETAPTGSAATIQLEYGDTDDLDTVASWTEIDSISHTAGAKTILTHAGFTNDTIPANRLIRMNLDAVGSTEPGEDLHVHLMVKRQFTT